MAVLLGSTSLAGERFAKPSQVGRSTVSRIEPFCFLGFSFSRAFGYIHLFNLGGPEGWLPRSGWLWLLGWKWWMFEASSSSSLTTRFAVIVHSRDPPSVSTVNTGGTRGHAMHADIYLYYVENCACSKPTRTHLASPICPWMCVHTAPSRPSNLASPRTPVDKQPLAPLAYVPPE